MTAVTAKAKPLLIAGSVAILVAVVGGAITELGPWYQDLQKPSWQPPDWLFAPVWTMIFALAALSAATAWHHAPERRTRIAIILFFALNIALNTLWSLFFFRLERPDWALLEVGLLWLSIVLLIVSLFRISRFASLLLVPYLVWVSFAAVLNWKIVELNGPF